MRTLLVTLFVASTCWLVSACSVSTPESDHVDQGQAPMDEVPADGKVAHKVAKDPAGREQQEIVIGDGKLATASEQDIDEAIGFPTVEPQQKFVVKGGEAELVGIMPADLYGKIINDNPADLRTSTINPDGEKQPATQYPVSIAYFDENVLQGRTAQEFVDYHADDPTKKFINTKKVMAQKILGLDAPGLMQYQRINGNSVARYYTYFVTIDREVFAIGVSEFDEQRVEDDPAIVDHLLAVLKDMQLKTV